MDTKEKDKMTYVPHRISPKQEFVMKATTEIQRNKRAYGDILLTLQGTQREESFWERKRILGTIKNKGTE